MEEREYVGIDLHRRRSVIYRMDAAGNKLDCVRIDNDPMRFSEEVAQLAPGTDVVVDQPTAGTGRSTCCRTWATSSIWPTRVATTGASAG